MKHAAALSLALFATAALTGCGAPDDSNVPALSPNGTATPPASCTVDFEASVRRGPSAGTTLRGLLTYSVAADGALTNAAMHTDEGQTIPVTGRAQGRDLSMRFDLGGGAVVNGNGHIDGDARWCMGRMEGPLTGPRMGDEGDWVGNEGATVVTTAGAVYYTVPSQHVVYRRPTATGIAEVWIGALGTPGNADNMGRRNVRLNLPNGLGFDETRRVLYIADQGNQSVRRYDEASNQVSTVVRVTHVSTASVAAGTGALSVFGPRGVAVNPVDGKVVVADDRNHTLWRWNPTNNATQLLAGRPALTGLVNATGTAARFNLPGNASAVRPGGAFFPTADQISYNVADTGNGVIRNVSSSGAVITVGAISSIH